MVDQALSVNPFSSHTSRDYMILEACPIVYNLGKVMTFTYFYSVL